MQETWETCVQSLGWEDTLEKEMATHSSVLAWEVPWTEEPGGLQSMGSQESDMTEHTCTQFIMDMVITIHVFKLERTQKKKYDISTYK